MTVVLFLVVLFVLVLVHEWGHFIAAKKTGMRVDEFGIGFPPKLFGVKKGETEYTFNIFPIGGFVRIYGENAEDAASDAAAHKDISRSFVAKSKLAQAIVLVAGVTMNVVFAWLLFVLVFSTGVPTSVEESMATDEARLVVADVLPGSPAALAELTPGTEIVGVKRNDNELGELTPTTFSEFTKADQGQIELSVLYDKEIKQISLEPQTGLIESSPDAPAIGVSLALVENVSMSLPEAINEATVTTVQSLKAIVVGLYSLIADSFKGTADFSQVAGPVGIVGLVGDAASFGFASLLMFTAIISLNLAVINLFPFPALDGGRLIFVAIEAITKKAINPVWVARLNFAGFALLILLMVAVTYSDITKLI